MRPCQVLLTHAQPSPALEPILADIPPSVTWRFLPPGEQLADHLAGVEVLYGNLPPDALPHAEALRWVQSQQTGVEVMMYPAFAARDILLTSLGPALSDTVAEHAVALLLALLRRLPEQRDLMPQGLWRPLPPRELSGLCVGIVGLGNIGRGVARRLAAFGSRLVAVDAAATTPPPEVATLWPAAELPQLLAAADAVIATLPSTPATRGLFDAAAFAAMREDAVFINVSRGEVVRTDDLAAALVTGRPAAAALDVTDPEPLPADHPLWRLPNLLLTPHTAGVSQNVQQRKLRWFVDNLQRYLTGQPLAGLVDLSRGW